MHDDWMASDRLPEELARKHLKLLDAVALRAWREVTEGPAEGADLSQVFKKVFRDKIEDGLKRRCVNLSPTQVEILLQLYHASRPIPRSAREPLPHQWSAADPAGPDFDPEGAVVHRNESFTKVQLSGASLRGHVFFDCAFDNVDLSNAELAGARFHSCTFHDVSLRNADLREAGADKCTFDNVSFSGADMRGFRFWYPTWAEGAKGDAFTRISIPLEDDLDGFPRLASWQYQLYLDLLSDRGLPALASSLAYHRKRAKTACLPFGPRKVIYHLVSLLSGYGEKPTRYGVFLLCLVSLYALAYWKLGLLKATWLAPGGSIPFKTALYFSVITFITVGYGDIRPTEDGWAQLVAAAEGVMGYISMVLLTAMILHRINR